MDELNRIVLEWRAGVSLKPYASRNFITDVVHRVASVVAQVTIYSPLCLALRDASLLLIFDFGTAIDARHGPATAACRRMPGASPGSRGAPCELVILFPL